MVKDASKSASDKIINYDKQEVASGKQNCEGCLLKGLAWIQVFLSPAIIYSSNTNNLERSSEIILCLIACSLFISWVYLYPEDAVWGRAFLCWAVGSVLSVFKAN